MKTRTSSISSLLAMALVCVFFTPWGYIHFSAIILLSPFYIHHAGYNKLYGLDALVLFIFSISYTIFMIINHGLEPGAGTLLKFLFVPILFFMSGQIFAITSNDLNKFITTLAFLVFFFSLIVATSITVDIFYNGFISIDRNIQIIGEGNNLKNATGVNSIISIWIAMIGFVFYKPENRFKTIVSTVLISLSLLALTLSLRLGSRTGLVIVATSLFGGYLVSMSSYTLFRRLVSSLLM